MSKDKIIIRGIRQHNLKNINVDIPRNKLVVITGISGSGKSSLAFDTIYAEGQRRYVESLSAYARQFLEMMEKPDVDYIEGLSPAIAIEQKSVSKNPRSTVGTITEIYDYLRLLFAHIGTVYCYQCGKQIQSQSPSQIVEKIMKYPVSTKIQVLAPLVRGRKGEYTALLEKIKQEGYVRVRIDGIIHDLEEDIRIDKNKKHNIEIVIDRLVVKSDNKPYIADSVETALKLAEGLALIVATNKKTTEEKLFSQKFSCPHCEISYSELTPRMFSFNSPYGACPECHGLGEKMEVDADLIVPDKNKSLAEGAVEPWDNPVTTKRHMWKRSVGRYFSSILESLSYHYKFNLNTPFKDLPENIRNIILYGSGDELIKFDVERAGQLHSYQDAFEGVVGNIERRYHDTDSEYVKEEIYRKYIILKTCPECKGQRLKKEALSVKIKNKSIAEVTSLTIEEVLAFFENLKLTSQEELISHQILKEIKARLKFLMNVGLDYISLDRKAETLSGGETARTRLATQIGSSLVGVLYILDEPTVGLHQRDTGRLITTLKNLRDLGNTIIIVEHDENTIKSADHIIDLGPGAGEYGGRIVAQGTPQEIMRSKNSLTGKYLKKELIIPIPEKNRIPKKGYLEILGAEEHNLKKINVKFPLGLFICITGVSGSGKSTLVDEILFKGLARILYNSKIKAGIHDKIIGADKIDKVINITQEPIGRTPRSNPATYTDTFGPIREIFSKAKTARIRGYKSGRFSFNVKGGRCEQCSGEGLLKIEMHFLPDVYVTCESCKGKRYNNETLEVKYKGKNIAEVLNMSVEEALKFFENIPVIRRKLQTLNDVGLGYIKLGQSATTLSGGEAQRIKLAKELSKVATGNTVYILDEPTTGLHFADTDKLLKVLNRLVDKGNTLIVIEHNPDVIKIADYIIDLGPEGGDKGGKIVAEGTPEEISLSEQSYTGKVLNKILNLKE
jgi:excinuclease ABC subunit A